MAGWEGKRGWTDPKRALTSREIARSMLLTASAPKLQVPLSMTSAAPAKIAHETRITLESIEMSILRPARAASAQARSRRNCDHRFTRISGK